MNRSELVQRVADEAGLDRGQADRAVSAFIDAVVKETKAGEKVSLFGFGTFNPTSRAARIGRNPQTGAPVKIAASKSVRFAPAAAYKSTLNGSKGAAKSAPKKAAAKSSAKKSPAKKTTAKKAAKSARKR
ncbi:MAG TPA: HU family DNA-binding protein [Acidimicrobiales bacterium]|nr:HU family DNA-binding protein [Acidimicrobiales bacterium]